MQITVEFFAQLATAVGCKSRQVSLEAGASARDVIDFLADQYGDAFRQLVLQEDGQPRAGILLFHGGAQTRWTDTTPLRDGDQLLLATPLAGG